MIRLATTGSHFVVRLGGGCPQQQQGVLLFIVLPFR